MLQIMNGKRADIKTENDFHNPLGLLSDCHRRIEKFLEQIIRVCEVAQGEVVQGEVAQAGVLQEQQREALAIALRYFRQAAPLHTADEETSLFPRVRELAAKGDEVARQALAIMEQLEAEHDVADLRHAIIDELGMRWLAQSTLEAAEIGHLKAEAQALRAFYAAHIAVEDHELFPLAKQLLAPDAIEKLGREMAARRGLDFDNLPAGSSCAARKAAQAKT